MMMARTTIQLDEDTKRILERIKVERGAKSYAEAIRLIIEEAKALDRGERGSLPKLESFMRDKVDRLDR